MDERVVLVCGPAGAGKSTHAARLAADGYLRLSFDRLACELLDHREHPLSADSAAAVHYLRASEATMRARVADRRGTGPDDLLVPPELMARYVAGFEVPTEVEGPLRVIET